eukprot:TRINITY_DN2679_c0_g2_i1.p1 TRINITY_DN2679_c0_g2~~TRINITY_DN2679_c0_g2_i1.p1  ORF type:complete len:402 (+),score=53.09 TRINITY_DN2679_c0_g2_i1:54-1259(+)
MEIPKLGFTKLLVVLACIGIVVSQTWTEIAILTASNKAAADQFGLSISLTDNYALSGAYLAKPGSLKGAGSAYVFVRSGTTWTEQAILTASNKAIDSNFGISVSVTDNYALVGAYYAETSTVYRAGAAYVFTRSGTTWTEQAILTATDISSFGEFGVSVSLTDNYALVGARSASPSSIFSAGAAYIFVRSGATWIQQTILTASNKASGDYFGAAVCNTDNYALVGAFYSSVGSLARAGSAYIYARYGSIWVEQAILTASDKKADDMFGYSVSMTDNYALIGASDTARSYIFVRSGTVWIQAQILSYSAGLRGVAITENYAMVRNNIFTRSGTSWTYQTTLRRSVLTSVALTENYAMVGDSTAATGGQLYAGDAYIFLNPDAVPKDQGKTANDEYVPVIARR